MQYHVKQKSGNRGWTEHDTSISFMSSIMLFSRNTYAKEWFCDRWVIFQRVTILTPGLFRLWVLIQSDLGAAAGRVLRIDRA